MRDEVSGRWRIHDEELHNLKSSPDFIQTTTVKDEENGGGGGRGDMWHKRKGRYMYTEFW